MIETLVIVLAVALVVVVGCLAWTTIVANAFKLWLELRERERLSATDRVELNKRMDAYDAKLLELKNIVSATRTR